jgi:thiosulfate reductase cytochrome b subunit
MDPNRTPSGPPAPPTPAEDAPADDVGKLRTADDAGAASIAAADNAGPVRAAADAEADPDVDADADADAGETWMADAGDAGPVRAAADAAGGAAPTTGAAAGVSRRAARAEREARPVRVASKHHALVRLSHWGHVPLLVGLIVTGLAIYWAAPVFHHAPSSGNPRGDYLVDLGRLLAGLFGAQGDTRYWLYDRLSLGPAQLASALRLHWLLAYLYMVCGALYVLGLGRGGGWRALLPRASDPAEALAMLRYYLGLLPAALARRPWPHPDIPGKYNALQRGAYFTMPILGLLVVLSGWAMHHPATLGWLERLFVNYNGARVVHFACMAVLGSFMVPHVLLVAADGFDTFRSMVTGWSTRLKGTHHG